MRIANFNFVKAGEREVVAVGGNSPSALVLMEVGFDRGAAHGTLLRGVGDSHGSSTVVPIELTPTQRQYCLDVVRMVVLKVRVVNLGTLRATDGSDCCRSKYKS